MKKVKQITGIKNILEIVDKTNDPIISICCPGERPEKLSNRYGKEILELDFHDTNINYQQWLAPKIEDLEKALEWAKDKKNIIVHCTAGKSRSTSIAFGILIQEGIDKRKVWKKIKKMSPEAIPNHLIMSWIGEKFSIDINDIGINKFGGHW